MLTLSDVLLEEVSSDDARSWWIRRGSVREPGEENDWQDDGFPTRPGVDHFQTKTMIPGSVNGFGYVMPSQPLDELNGTRVEEFKTRIQDGEHPAAIALGWAEDKYVQAEFAERSLMLTLLDGHHKTKAYTELSIPTRLVTLCRLEDTWGPPDDPGRTFLELLRAASSEF